MKAISELVLEHEKAAFPLVQALTKSVKRKLVLFIGTSIEALCFPAYFITDV